MFFYSFKKAAPFVDIDEWKRKHTIMIVLGFLYNYAKKRSVSRAIGEGGEMSFLYISTSLEIGPKRLKQKMLSSSLSSQSVAIKEEAIHCCLSKLPSSCMHISTKVG